MGEADQARWLVEIPPKVPLQPRGRGGNGAYGGEQKRPESLDFSGIPACFGPCRPLHWWRWAELNRRPKALHPWHYMLSSPLGLVLWQHGERSAPKDQPVLVKP